MKKHSILLLKQKAHSTNIDCPFFDKKNKIINENSDCVFDAIMKWIGNKKIIVYKHKIKIKIENKTNYDCDKCLYLIIYYYNVM